MSEALISISKITISMGSYNSWEHLRSRKEGLLHSQRTSKAILFACGKKEKTLISS
jgi:hypothetical protein